MPNIKILTTNEIDFTSEDKEIKNTTKMTDVALEGDEIILSIGHAPLSPFVLTKLIDTTAKLCHTVMDDNRNDVSPVSVSKISNRNTNKINSDAQKSSSPQEVSLHLMVLGSNEITLPGKSRPDWDSGLGWCHGEQVLSKLIDSIGLNRFRRRGLQISPGCTVNVKLIARLLDYRDYQPYIAVDSISKSTSIKTHTDEYIVHTLDLKNRNNEENNLNGQDKGMVDKKDEKKENETEGIGQCDPKAMKSFQKEMKDIATLLLQSTIREKMSAISRVRILLPIPPPLDVNATPTMMKELEQIIYSIFLECWRGEADSSIDIVKNVLQDSKITIQFII